MIHYCINHYVTDGDGPMDSTLHGDDALCVWVDSDPTTAEPDHRHDQPPEGWDWQTDIGGWKQHPDALSEYATNPTDVVRVDPWDTALTDGY